ncbi:MAG: hypothetical protein ACM3XM_05240 [Mycobacterium leprae]
MALSRVKLFFDFSHSDLSAQLAEWLDETMGQIRVTGVTMDSNQHGHCIAVLYQETPGPVYRAHVWFNWSHMALQQDVNEGLAAVEQAEGRFVALGSNDHGHCLCIIAEAEGMPEIG